MDALTPEERAVLYAERGDPCAPAVAPLSLQPYQMRVVDEHAALELKRNALRVFFGMPAFEQVSEEERVDLVSQFELMSAYAHILARRISRFMP